MFPFRPTSFPRKLYPSGFSLPTPLTSHTSLRSPSCGFLAMAFSKVPGPPTLPSPQLKADGGSLSEASRALTHLPLPHLPSGAPTSVHALPLLGPPQSCWPASPCAQSPAEAEHRALQTCSLQQPKQAAEGPQAWMRRMKKALGHLNPEPSQIAPPEKSQAG